MGEERGKVAFFVNEDGEIIRNRKCPRCGRILSSEGDFCEFCGTQLKSSKSRNFKWTPLVVILAFCILVIGGMILYQHFLHEPIIDGGGVFQEGSIEEYDSKETSFDISPNKERQFCFDGITLDFSMNLKEMNRENEKSVIKRYKRKDNWDDDVAISYHDGYYYYLINNKIAVGFNDMTQCIAWVCTQSRNFSTLEGTHVGDLWGKMTEVYPQLKFYIDLFHYNHFTHKESPATIAYDENECVSFVFYLDQFSHEQEEAISSVSNPSDFDAYYDVNDVQKAIYQSICNSIKIDEIKIWKK